MHGRWVIAGALALGLIVGACAHAAPPPSVTPTPAADTLPEIQGLRILTVETASRLILDGKLDGRAAAVAGYWLKPSSGMSCGPAIMIRPSFLEWSCRQGGITDAPRSLGTYEEFPDGSSSFSWRQPENGIGFLDPAGSAGPGQPGRVLEDRATIAWQVVVVGHAGDPRSWECAAAARAACRQRFVVDRVVWVDGTELDLGPGLSEAEPSLGIEQVFEAAATDVGNVVHVELISLGGIPYPDPRLGGLDVDLAWVVTAVVGEPDAAGTLALEFRVVDDATGALVSTSPFMPTEDLTPARLVLLSEDNRTPSGGGWGSPRASATDSTGRTIAEGRGVLGGPIVIPAGEYRLEAWIASDDDEHEFQGTRCSTTIQLEELDDLYWRARFPPVGPCLWEETTALL